MTVMVERAPIENIHAGKTCPACNGVQEYCHITEGEMKQIMKKAVNRVYSLLWLREHDRDHPKVN